MLLSEPSLDGVGTLLIRVVTLAASDPNVRDDVILNHDDNRWWPLGIVDWRMRLVVAGWSTRVSYQMIESFSATVSKVDTLGYDALLTMSDRELGFLLRPLGMVSARVRYFRSVADYVDKVEAGVAVDPRVGSLDVAIEAFQSAVWGAAFKVAQCAVLYVRGYHCGIMPVDSGMIEMLAPCLGIEPGPGPLAHERVRRVLEANVRAFAFAYRDIARRLGYLEYVDVPDGPPTWWVHLVLVYFKRKFCNVRSPDSCPLRRELGGSLGRGCDRSVRVAGGVRRLAIEGVDGVGKTSLAQELSQRGFEISHFSYRPAVIDIVRDYRDAIARISGPTIWDRSFLSEVVYGETLRGASRISRSALLELADAFVSGGGAIVILLASPEAVLGRLHADGRLDEYDGPRTAALHAGFEDVGGELQRLKLATLIDSSDITVRELGSWLTRNLPLWYRV